MGVTFGFRHGIPDQEGIKPWLEQYIGQRGQDWSTKRIDVRKKDGGIWFTPTVTIVDNKKAALFALRWGGEILEHGQESAAEELDQSSQTTQGQCYVF
jgi:hypothetical protein